MSADENIAVVRAWVEDIWNFGNLAHLERFHPPTLNNHGRQTTVEEVRQWHQRNRAAFPDIHYTIDAVFAVDDHVALRWTATATHMGTLWNLIPATHRHITWGGMHMLRLVHLQIVEIWAVQDTVAQLQQMGVTLHP